MENLILFGAAENPVAYGIIATIGILTAGILAFWSILRRGHNPETVLDLVLIGLPFGVVGARLYFMIFNDASAPFFWDWFKVWEDGGLAIYGGVFGALIAAFIAAFVIFRRRKDNWNKLSLLQILDVAFVCLLIGHTIGLWGNFANTGLYGNAIENGPKFFPFAVEDGGTFYHAIFFYESLLNLAGFALLFWLYNFCKRKCFDGFYFAGYCIWYGIVRMIFEPMRADKFILWMIPDAMPVSVFVSMLFVLLGAGILSWHLIRAKNSGTKLFLFVHEDELDGGYCGYHDSIFFKRKEWNWEPGMKFVDGIPANAVKKSASKETGQDEAAVGEEAPLPKKKRVREEINEFDDEI